MSSSVQERLKLKRITLDTWSTKEKLSLASSVLRSGDQNWSCVSRNIRLFAEPNRPPDWFSQKNCAQQYASLLENVETPKRKKRAAGSTEKSEVETPGECIVRKLTAERVEELKKSMLDVQGDYLKLKDDINKLISGESDDKLANLVQELEDDKKQKEHEKEAHIKWLKEREERKIELERAWKPGTQLANLRRASSMSEPSSEADSPLSEPLNVDVPEEAVLTKATPTSPLLTSLLKSPSTNVQANSSILHSAITSPHRGSSPTIASLLSSSPGLPGNLVMPPSNVSPNLKNLVSNAISGPFSEEHKTVPQSPSQGAPTLSMLLELPPSMPGKPLPMLQSQPLAPPPYTVPSWVTTDRIVVLTDETSGSMTNFMTRLTSPESVVTQGAPTTVPALAARLSIRFVDRRPAEHLGPPPPYSQATEYLQKQRAEQLAQQTQAQLQFTPQQAASQLRAKVKIEEESTSSLSTHAELVTTPLSTSAQPLPITGRRGSLKGRRLDMGDGEVEDKSETTPTKPSPAKEKDTKRVLHNTSDHDYIESPIKDKDKSEPLTPKKTETDVFEFDEQKEGYDKFDLMKDSKMSYLKSVTAHKKKDSEIKAMEPKSYLRETPVHHEPKIVFSGENDEDLPLKDLVKKETEDAAVLSPKRDRVSLSPNVEGRRSARNSSDGKQDDVETTSLSLKSLVAEEPVKKDKPKTTDIDVVVVAAPEKSPVKEEDLTNDDSTMGDSETEKKKSEVSEEQSEVEEPEDSESIKDEDTLSLMTDTMKSEKADLSTTEDEKSNDAAPKVYSRRRGTTSLSDSVPSSPAPFTEEEKEYKTWKKSVLLVYTRLAGHKFASLFLKPITDDQAPGYSSTVHRPMDLSTIKRNIELGHTRTTGEFQRDVMLMFLNALMYNKTNHHVFNMANEMQADSIEHFQMMHQATGENAPSRRETRTQQSGSDVKRVSEKTGRQSKVDSEKWGSGSGRSSRGGSLRSSPGLSEKARKKSPPPPSKRKRPVSTSESNRKRQKVDD